jgi:hypothetical protein
VGFHHALKCTSVHAINRSSNDNLIVAVKHTR